METTVIGSFPKPDFLEIPDWFKTGLGRGSGQATRQYNEMLECQSVEEKAALEMNILKATEHVLDVQCSCGVRVVTDGEVRRENYIHYLCRRLEGIDFHNLAKVSVRNGAYIAELPTVTGPVRWRDPKEIDEMVAEWKIASEMLAQGRSATQELKYTVPGPLTIMGTLQNNFYADEVELGQELADVVNVLIRRLREAGCRYIQLDEPLFARRPDPALEWAIDNLNRCFEGVSGEECERQVHICCGYPENLDQKGYAKADPHAYVKIASAMDNCASVDAVSLEDAHCYNDLAALLPLYKNKKIIFGCVQSASSRVETQEEIEARLETALRYIEPERLVVAPDCGLALLPPDVLKAKLHNMCSAAASMGKLRVPSSSTLAGTADSPLEESESGE